MDEISEATRQEYEALLQFLYIAPIGLAQVHADGQIVMVNPLCAQLLMPLARNGDLANLFVALKDVAPDLRLRVDDFDASSGMICDAMHLHVTAAAAGRKEAQVLSLTLLKLDEARLMAVLGDVTQAVSRERELRQSRAWIHTIVTGRADYALVSLDPQGHCQSCHPSIERVTGFTQAAVIGKDYSIFYPSDVMNAARAKDRLHEAEHSGWSLDEGWRQRADGARYWGSCLIAPLQEPSRPETAPQGYTLVLRDISERREETAAIRRSLWSDHLTGLSNRRVLYETAEAEFRRWQLDPRALSVVMIDADHFKQINDRHGHAAGDAVLRRLAVMMSQTFAPRDTIARLGGEEFVALLPGTGVQAAVALAERLRQSIESQPAMVDQQAIGYTVSVGVAGMDADVSTVDTLLARADVAMYAAKQAGRNRVAQWDASMHKLSRDEIGMSRDDIG